MIHKEFTTITDMDGFSSVKAQRESEEEEKVFHGGNTVMG